VSQTTDFAQQLLTARCEALKQRLDALTPEDRWALVDAARSENRWPSDQWLRDHAAEHSPERTPEQYRAWAQAIKRRPGTQVYALIHIIHGNEALAFIDPRERSLVWFDLDSDRNLSCFYIEETFAIFLAHKGTLYWRLPDVELT
jgi:hypothetical protein